MNKKYNENEITENGVKGVPQNNVVTNLQRFDI